MSRLVILFHHFSSCLVSIRLVFIARLINLIFVRLLCNCQIGINAKLGSGVILGYGGLGVVIHDRTVIGSDVIVGPGVTIGGTNKNNVVPIIGDNCYISTGAKIIGPVKIGKNCVIGANAVVLDDIPDNCVVVGVPARIVKRDINITEYR